MHLNADFWLVLSPRTRLLCWLFSVLCGGLLLWWFSISPLKNALGQQLSQQAALQNALHVQWRKLREMSLPIQHEPDAESLAFTPLDFQGEGRQLIRWQPAQNGGEMVLETGWSTVVGTFPLMARRYMLIPAFSLIADETNLRFTLRLEHDDVR